MAVLQTDDMTQEFEAALAAPTDDVQADSSSTDPDPTPDPKAEAQAETPASEATVETPPSEEPVAATAQPDGQAAETETAQTDAPAEDDSTEGEPPKERWGAILKNQRQKAADEARQAVQAEYAWAKDLAGLPEQERAALVGLHRGLNTNAVQTVQQLQQALAANPAYAAQLQAQQASTAPPVQAKQDVEPQPDLENKSDGSLVYSAKRMQEWSQWRERQLEQRLTSTFEQQLAPVQEVVADHQRSQVVSGMASMLGQFDAEVPGFKEHHPAVAAEIQKDQQLLILSDTDPRAAVEVAWSRLHRASEPDRTKALRKTLEAEIRANFQQKAAAGSANPATPNVTAPKKFEVSEKGFQDALEAFSR